MSWANDALELPLEDMSRPFIERVVENLLEVWCERHRDEIRPAEIEYAALLMDRVGYEMMRRTVDERPN